MFKPVNGDEDDEGDEDDGFKVNSSFDAGSNDRATQALAWQQSQVQRLYYITLLQPTDLWMKAFLHSEDLNGSLAVVVEALFVYLDEDKQHGKMHKMYANFRPKTSVFIRRDNFFGRERFLCCLRGWEGRKEERKEGRNRLSRLSAWSRLRAAAATKEGRVMFKCRLCNISAFKHSECSHVTCNYVWHDSDKRKVCKSPGIPECTPQRTRDGWDWIMNTVYSVTPAIFRGSSVIRFWNVLPVER